MAPNLLESGLCGWPIECRSDCWFLDPNHPISGCVPLELSLQIKGKLRQLVEWNRALAETSADSQHHLASHLESFWKWILQPLMEQPHLTPHGTEMSWSHRALPKAHIYGQSKWLLLVATKFSVSLLCSNRELDRVTQLHSWSPSVNITTTWTIDMFYWEDDFSLFLCFCTSRLVQ